VYISPSFYPSKAKTGEVVPTWDYAVVHASGTLRFIEDAGWLRSFVSGLTDTYETPRSQPWKIDDAPAAYVDKMLKLMVGVESSIASLAGKWKVSQNRPQADKQGVIDNLHAAHDADSHEIAAMLAGLSSGPDSPPAR
jgi:transcriptional regulator